MYTQGMDNSHACLFELNLNNDWFNEYEIGEDETYRIGINCELLFKILNCLGEEQNIELKISIFQKRILNCGKISFQIMKMKSMSIY